MYAGEFQVPELPRRPLVRLLQVTMTTRRLSRVILLYARMSLLYYYYTNAFKSQIYTARRPTDDDFVPCTLYTFFSARSETYRRLGPNLCVGVPHVTQVLLHTCG